MTQHKIIISAILFVLFSATFGIIEQYYPFQSVSAQRTSITGQDTAANQTQAETTNQQETFRSVFDTFVTSKPTGYGMYEEKESNTFRPGETILLYIEPAGFEYETLTGDDGDTLYRIGFTADFVLSDSEGNIVGGQQGIPTGEIISHRQNKEVFIPFTITQSAPFPPGNYTITYTIYDVNSGKSFDIVKDIVLSEEQSF